MCPSTATDAAFSVQSGPLRGERVPLLRFDGDPDRPDEAQELASHGGHHLLPAFPAAEQLAVAGTQAVLSPTY